VRRGSPSRNAAKPGVDLRARRRLERRRDLLAFKVWPCLFPQHGAGRKHERRIALVPWQEAIVELEPGKLLRGLIHSDGCRILNRVNGTDYPRYFFSQVSMDIQELFRRTCGKLGVECANNRSNSISVARRHSVAKLDAIVGSKS